MTEDYRGVTFEVPTIDYNADMLRDHPRLNVHVAREPGGLRVILGNRDAGPDLLIEKVEDHWRILLHKPFGGDLTVCVQIMPEATEVRDDMGELLTKVAH